MKRNGQGIVVLVLLVGACIYGYTTLSNAKPPQDALTIAMLDIGQGDAIYIRTPQGKDILIDGGPDRHLIHELGAVMPPFDNTLELVIATHPDADHIAGLTEMPYIYNIGTLITSGVSKSTNFAREMDGWGERYGVESIDAHRGWYLQLEDEVWLEFLHPNPPHFHEDPNDDSVVFFLHYREFTGLFTGDASIENEHDFLQNYAPAQGWSVDLLKVGHHGSKTSTSNELLDATTPEVALISVGLENKFGHPHAGPMNRLARRDISVWRTDMHGRVLCTVTTELTCTHHGKR